jgi:hypothetical protein
MLDRRFCGYSGYKISIFSEECRYLQHCSDHQSYLPGCQQVRQAQDASNSMQSMSKRGGLGTQLGDNALLKWFIAILRHADRSGDLFSRKWMHKEHNTILGQTKDCNNS